MKSEDVAQKIPQNEAQAFEALVELAQFLRSPEGCPWDRKQSAASFAGYILEEGRELIEALEEGDNEKIAEEWGDTFFTLIACMAAAEEEGRFDLLSALKAAHQKMVRRHAHIFGDQTAETPEEVMAVWNAIKAQEKANKKGPKASGKD